MKNSTLIKNVNIVNRGKLKSLTFYSKWYYRIYWDSSKETINDALIIDGTGKHLFQGLLTDKYILENRVNP
jgi:hypothetical protein